MILTGTFDTTTLSPNNGDLVAIDPTFSTIVTDPSGGQLTIGDIAAIDATIISEVPEPD